MAEQILSAGKGALEIANNNIPVPHIAGPLQTIEYEAVLQAITDLVWVQDRDFKLLWANKVFTDTFKTLPEEIIGKKCFEVVHQTKEPICRCPQPQVIKSKLPAREELFAPCMGIFLEVWTSPILNEGKEVVAVVHIARDVSSRKQAEEKIKESEEKVRQEQTKTEELRARLQEKLSTVEILAAGVAHEIRNPLAVISMTVQYLQSKLKGTDPNRELTEAIIKKVERLDRVTGQLSSYGRAERLNVQRYSLLKCLNMNLALVKSKCRWQKIKIQKKYSPLAPIKMDEEQMDKVFLNIFDNAVQAMPKGGILSVSAQYNKEVDMAVVRIHNTGPAIPKKHLPHIFEPFYTLKKHNGGTGLGLTIARSVILAHNGYIEVENKGSGKDKGVAFVIRLPLTPPSKICRRRILGKVNKSKEKILVVDDEPEIGWIFARILGDNGYQVISSRSAADGLAKAQKLMPELVFVDLRLPDKDGIQVLKEIKKMNPAIVVILITAHETVQTAVAAMKWGAYDYIPKPVPNERLTIIVEKAMENQRLTRQIAVLTKPNAALCSIIGQSPCMQKLFDLIKSVALYEVSVILRGESGTGKELAAAAIHSLSKRNRGPFVPIDCATLPESLVESELFGYEKGAFTGADSLKTGKFEQAHQGTIFLDEIGNIGTNIQVKLLRVLQEKKIERLGGRKPVAVDVRVVTATNRDLEEAVENNEFRNDLYHRLNVFEIQLPPLRERDADVVLLAHSFLDRFNRETGKDIKGFSDDVLDLFQRYSWPGNVRELENTVKSAMILANDKILPEHLSGHIKKSWRPAELPNQSPLREKCSLKEAKKNATIEAEKYLIEKTLRETNWNRTRAAKILGIDYKSLLTKIKAYEVK